LKTILFTSANTMSIFLIENPISAA